MTLEVVIEGIGLWAAELPGWDASRELFRGSPAAQNPAARPAPSLLAPTERRRAPDSVLLALEVAQQATAMAGREACDMPIVFASAFGDLAINDYLCASLTESPLQLSPTKFHNSVHNAPAGYWAIATGCMAGTTAVSAGEATFGAGLFEAALLATAENVPVLFAVYDLAAIGPLADVIACRAPFAAAFVLAPRRERPGASLRLAPCAGAAELAPGPPLLQAVYQENPAARCLPLLSALAEPAARTFSLSAGPHLMLHTEVGLWLS